MVVVQRSTVLPSPLRGVVPPIVTPLDAQGALDVDGLKRVLAHVLDGGVHALFMLGTTGEVSGLSGAVRRDLVTHTCRIVAGRVPVLVGITDPALDDSLDLARHAADAGADAVVISTPYYLPLEQSELIDYASAILARQPLPVFLYNIPLLARTEYEPDTVRRLAERPRVLGIKDSSGDPSYLRKVRRLVGRDDFSLLVGTELHLPAAMADGAHGCVGGGANILPRLFSELYNATARGEADRVAALMERAARLDGCYRLSLGVASIVRGIKCAMSLMGLCQDHMAAPYRRYAPAERAQIARCLSELGVELPDEAQGPPVSSRPSTSGTAASIGSSSHRPSRVRA